MATDPNETLGLHFAFVSNDGAFVGNKEAVIAYNASHPAKDVDPLKGYRLPWEYRSEFGQLRVVADISHWPTDRQYRRFLRAFAALDEQGQRDFLLSVPDED